MPSCDHSVSFELISEHMHVILSMSKALVKFMIKLVWQLHFWSEFQSLDCKVFFASSILELPPVYPLGVTGQL